MHVLKYILPIKMKKGTLHFCTRLIFMEYEMPLMTTGIFSCGISNSASLSVIFFSVFALVVGWRKPPFLKTDRHQGWGVRKVLSPGVALGTLSLYFWVPLGWKRQAGAPAAETVFHLYTEANVESYLGWCLLRSGNYSHITITHLCLFVYACQSKRC